jgi:GR25 family glycosyltransferase involved in LPS biosynthesis
MLAVFEDDVVFSPRFKDIFPAASQELPAQWKFWQFHSSRAKTQRSASTWFGSLEPAGARTVIS